MKRILLGGLGAVLVVAVCVCTITVLGGRSETDWVPLASRVPKEIGGWMGEDVPLGQNEMVLQAVGRLNYEDYIYRVYRKDHEEVYIYAMHWRQGQISVREMSGHTPDGCWVSNGARHCAPAARFQLKIDGRNTAVAEVRSFQFPNEKQPINVAWWHVWGGQLVDRGFARKTVVPMLREIWVWLARRGGQPRDQLLVRVHSVLPIAEMQEAAPVQKFLWSLPVVFEATPISADSE